MNSTVPGTVYFDNAATTPPLPEVIAKFDDLSRTVTGNPSSSHRRGRQARDVLDEAHETLGRIFDVPPGHVIFTSGGTESNNLAVWGAIGGLEQGFKWIKSGASGQLVTSTIEHSSLSGVFEALEGMGARVSWADVDSEGLLKPESFDALLGTRTKLVSLHHLQSEIGIVQDIAAMSRLVRSRQPDALIHIDAVQSFLKVPVSLVELGVDMLSLSAHKFAGPKGIGALILGRRFESRHPRLAPFLLGASQQWGIRPGTVPVPLIGSMVTAADWGVKHYDENRKKLLALRTRLLSKLPSRAILNGPRDTSESNARRAPQTVNFSLPGIPSAAMVEEMSARNFCISAGSACHSTHPQPNATLMKMTAGRDRALSAIRVSFSPFNTVEEVDLFVDNLAEAIARLGD